jgi:3',5'-cyclic AMP phosphodiesterase CpdA
MASCFCHTAPEDCGLTLLMHISDLHFGPPIRRDRVEALEHAVSELRPDLVVASGDFVQRADFPGQFVDAQLFLRRLRAPVLPVPGNHELPLLNPVVRLLQPYARYLKYIHPELEPEHRARDVHVMAVNSTKPYLIHNGLTTVRQLEQLGARIARHPDAGTRVVATHHPLARLDGVRSQPQAWSGRTLRGFACAGVDLVLSGHFHSFRVLRASNGCRGLSREIYLVFSGSTTSCRVRKPHHRGNGFATIAVGPGEFRVVHHLFREGHGFAAEEEQLLSRA